MDMTARSHPRHFRVHHTGAPRDGLAFVRPDCPGGNRQLATPGPYADSAAGLRTTVTVLRYSP